MLNFKKFYEKYHKDVSLPKRIIEKKEFTYRNIIAVLDKYCKSRNILDVGSGVGTLDFYLAKKGKYITGIEISERAFNIANKALKVFGLKSNIKFILGDFLKLKTKGEYDFVICSEVLEHLESDKKALKKISKLTKKGGLVMITVPSSNAPLIKFGAIKEFDKKSGHLRRYTAKSLKKLLENYNLKVIYTKNTEGILRNSLYVFRPGHQIVRIANKFIFVSDIITFLDNVTLKLFGESQLIAIAKK